MQIEVGFYDVVLAMWSTHSKHVKCTEYVNSSVARFAGKFARLDWWALLQLLVGTFRKTF